MEWRVHREYKTVKFCQIAASAAGLSRHFKAVMWIQSDIYYGSDPDPFLASYPTQKFFQTRKNSC